MAKRLRSKMAIAALITGLVLLGAGAYVWKQEHRPKVLEVWVFALKSGRSMFIRTPNDRRILIDGGSNADIVRELTSILPFYSRRIDVVMATNSEGKNVSGLIDVLDRYEVGRVYIPAQTLQSLGLASSTDQIYGTFLGEVDSTRVPLEKLAAGQSLDLDPEADVRMNILFPAEPNKIAYSKTSGPELLFDLKFGCATLLFMGSATPKVQKYVASSTPVNEFKAGPRATNVLVVSHSALPANMSKELAVGFAPDHLVYSKSGSSVSAKPSKPSKPKKPVIDPLAGIPTGNKWNIKETGRFHLVSDGANVEFK